MSEVAKQVMSERDARRVTERIREAVRDLNVAAALKANTKVKPRAKTQYLYLMQSGINGPVKVGVANDVEARRRQLQTGNPFRVRVITVIPDAAQREFELHDLFGHFRLEGEWFEPIQEIFDWFKIQEA